MYRLASKVRVLLYVSALALTCIAYQLGLEDLKQKAFIAIEQALTKDNIVKELFSDFTWR